MKKNTSLHHERRQRIMLGISAGFLIVTVVLLIQFFKPEGQFDYVIDNIFNPASSVQKIAIPLEELARPRYVTLKPRQTSSVAGQVAGLSTDPTAPAAPKNVRVMDIQTGSSLTVLWDAPVGYDDLSFHVYRSASEKTLGEVVYEGASERYRDTDVVRGVSYYYTVRSVSSAGEESINVTSIKGVPTDIFVPSAPTSVTVKNATEGEKIIVTWTNPVDEDFAYVNVYRSSTRGELGSRIATSVTAEVFEDTDIQDDVEYFYTVTAVDMSGNESTKEVIPVTGRDNPFVPI